MGNSITVSLWYGVIEGTLGPVPLCRTEWQRGEAACQQRRKVPDVGEFSGAAFAVEPVNDFAADVGGWATRRRSSLRRWALSPVPGLTFPVRGFGFPCTYKWAVLYGETLGKCQMGYPFTL